MARQNTSRARARMIKAACATALLTAAVGTGTAQAGTVHATSSRGGPGTAGGLECRGVGVDTTAPVISTGEILIHAPLSTVFRLQTDVNRWTSWRSDVVSAQRLDSGPLRAGSSFRWETGGLDVTSTVAAVKVNSCTAWGGPAAGIDGAHVWTYTRVRGGVLVRTMESWSGAPVEADVAQAQALLDASLLNWRQELKATAEATTVHAPRK